MLPQTLHGEPQATGWTGDQKCNQGPKLALWERLDLSMKMLRYASLRAAVGDMQGFTCYLLPSYTGGESATPIDGAWRFPMCFGAHGEPGAQPCGTRWTVHGEEPEGEELVVESGAGWRLSPRMEVA